jgi:hypothetical protein
MQKLSEDRWIIGFLVAVVAWAFFGLPIIYLNWQWLMHDAAGFFTSLLVLVGGLQLGLFAWQLTLIRKSLAPAEAAAKAATVAAESSFAAERARFFVVIDKHNLAEIVKLVENAGATESSGIPGGDNICILYRFKNYGKTPGIIRELIVDSMISANPVDPPALFLSTKDFPEYMIGANESTKALNYSPITHPLVGHMRSIGRNAARLWFFGRLYYDDVFGNHQVHRFYFRSISPLGGGDSLILRPFEYKDYNQSTWRHVATFSPDRF